MPRSRRSPDKALSVASDALAKELEQHSKGLLFLSESEAPLTVVTLPKEAIMPDALRELAHLPADAQAEEWQVTDLLEPFTVAPEGADEAACQQADRFRAVLDQLTKKLQRAVAYKLGETKKAVFFIGRQPDRSWLGLQTEAVET